MNRVQKSELNRTSITVVITAAALIVSIFAFASINGSVAWFANNKNVKAGGMNVTVADPESFVEKIEYFNISQTSLMPLTDDAPDNADPNQYKFSVDEDNTEVLSLGTYSLINDKMQILMKITFSENSSVENVRLSARSSYQGTIIPSSADSCSMSTIIHFSVFSGADIIKQTVTDSSGTNTYYVVSGPKRVGENSFSSLSDTGTASFTNEITVAESVSIAKPTASSETVDGVTNETLEEKAIYIILDYQRDVAQYVKETVELSNSGFFKENSEGENVLDFTECDFSLEINATDN